MAPYNLSDLAVKEIKIPRKNLAPLVAKSQTGNFLLAHFIDFWFLFYISSFSTLVYHGTLKTFLSTKGLHNAWKLADFSALSVFGWLGLTLTYFFTSYYFNNGQTLGMKYTKCRISLGLHDARASIRWALLSLSLYFTLGLSFRKGTSLLRAFGEIVSHDHLWQTMMIQREEVAPDLMKLRPVEEETDFAEAA